MVKRILSLDNGYKREDSVKDIGALLDWIATQPHLDENRVIVYGGSYGGYMVLASAVHYSDRLKGAVDIVGISNFVTFLKKLKTTDGTSGVLNMVMNEILKWKVPARNQSQ